MTIAIYPHDLTGMMFGYLEVVEDTGEIVNRNHLFKCVCHCGKPNCKHIVYIKRGNLTRQHGNKSCSTRDNFVQNTKRLENDKPSKNSTTNIKDIHPMPYGKQGYRFRVDVNGKTITFNNLSLDEAIQMKNLMKGVD